MHPSLENFRRAMGDFATGITIVTTVCPDGTPYGVTVNSFASLSLEPLLVLVCLDVNLSGLCHFEESNQFAVNILAEDQRNASMHFARPGSDRSRFRYRQRSGGMPLLDGCLAWLECDLVNLYPAGDHKILIGEVRRIERHRDRKRPLLFFRGRYVGLKLNK